MKKMALLLAALLLLSSLAGCGKSSKGKASVESVSMICGLSAWDRRIASPESSALRAKRRWRRMTAVRWLPLP